MQQNNKKDDKGLHFQWPSADILRHSGLTRCFLNMLTLQLSNFPASQLLALTIKFAGWEFQNPRPNTSGGYHIGKFVPLKVLRGQGNMETLHNPTKQVKNQHNVSHMENNFPYFPSDKMGKQLWD